MQSNQVQRKLAGESVDASEAHLVLVHGEVSNSYIRKAFM